DRLIAVRLVDAHGPRRADAVRLQKHHDGPHGLLLLPAFADALDTARADPLDLLEKSGALVNDGQGALAEDVDNLAREMWTDPLDEPGGEILGDALGRVRRSCPQLVRLELKPSVTVVDPAAACLNILAGHRVGQIADYRDQVTPAPRLDAQDNEAVLGILERDALDGPGKSFRHEAHFSGTL